MNKTMVAQKVIRGQSMKNDRFLLDTVFIQALLNRRDQYHNQAKAFLPRIRNAAEIWVTEAELIEVGKTSSVFNRAGAVQFIQQCYRTANMRVVHVDTSLLIRALQRRISCSSVG